MSKLPLISIIIPIYNVEDYLKRCVNSLLSQTYENLEIILVNDGSSDKSPLICDDYAREDKRIKVIHKRNEGVSIARNVALDICKGEYILFVDGDDFVSTSIVTLLYKSLTTNKSDIASCGYIHHYNGPVAKFIPQTRHEVVLSGEEALEDMLYQNNIAAGPVAKLYKRRLFDKVRYPVGIKFGEDLDVTYRVLLRSKRVVVNNYKEYYYQQRPGSAIQSSFTTSRMSSIKILRHVLEYIKKAHPALVNAAKNRVFMEAVFIISTIPLNPKFNKQREDCLNIIKRYRSQVILDSRSKLSYKVFALMSFTGPNALTRLRNMKLSLKNMKSKLTLESKL